MAVNLWVIDQLELIEQVFGRVSIMELVANRSARHASGLIAGLVSTALALSLLTGVGSASAAASTDGELKGSAGGVTQCAATTSVEEAGPEMEQADAETAAELSSIVLAETAAQGIEFRTDMEFVDLDGVKAYTVDFQDTTATTVTFPIVGDGFVQPSNVTFVLDEKGTILQYAEQTAVERPDGIIDVTLFQDGVQTLSTEFDPSNAAIEVTGEGMRAAAADSPALCLAAVLGVSSVVAGVILIVCGGSCSVPVTPPTATVCAACIGGIALIGGSSITAVMGCFTK